MPRRYFHHGLIRAARPSAVASQGQLAGRLEPLKARATLMLDGLAER